MFNFLKKLFNSKSKKIVPTTSVASAPAVVSISVSCRQTLAQIKPYKGDTFAKKQSELTAYDHLSWYKQAWRSVTTYLGWRKDIQQVRTRYTVTLAQHLLNSTKIDPETRQTKIAELAKQIRKLASSPVKKTLKEVNSALYQCSPKTIILQTIDDVKINETKKRLLQVYVEARQNLSMYDFSKQKAIRTKFNTKISEILQPYNETTAWESYALSAVNDARKELYALKELYIIEFEKLAASYKQNVQEVTPSSEPLQVTSNLQGKKEIKIVNTEVATNNNLIKTTNIPIEKVKTVARKMDVALKKPEFESTGIVVDIEKVKADQADISAGYEKIEADQAGIRARIEKLEADDKRTEIEEIKAEWTKFKVGMIAGMNSWKNEQNQQLTQDQQQVQASYGPGLAS
jgi:hypothetical protein